MTERPILFSAPMVRALLDGSKTQTRRVVKPQPPEWAQYPQPLGPGEFELTDRDVDADDLWHWPSYDKSLWCPYGKPGDKLWVKETWRTLDSFDAKSPARIADRCLDAGYSKPWAPIQYEADGKRRDWVIDGTPPGKTRVSIHMPRWASRILLEITEVRVERLQDISESDAQAEGVQADAPQTWWQGYKDCGDKMGLIHQQVMGDTAPDWMIEPHKMAPTPHLLRSAKQHYEMLWNTINGPGSWDANPWVWAISFKRVTP